MTCFRWAKWLVFALWLARCGCALAGTNEVPANILAFGEMVCCTNDKPWRALDASSLALGNTNNLRLLPTESIIISWPQPRDVREVVLQFEGNPPASSDITIQWWHRIWPDNGTGGWMKLDDPFNGNWTTVHAGTEIREHEMIFRFQPLTTGEAAGIRATGANFRRTYKLQISAKNPVTVTGMAVHTDATERQARLRFEWDIKTTVPGEWPPRFEARNGRLSNPPKMDGNSAIVELAYADNQNRLSADRGFVICRSGEQRSFSVFVDDVLREGGMFIRDIGVFVSNADKNITYSNWKGPTGEVWKQGTVMEQIGRMPEQTLARAMNAIPPKPPTHIFLGLPDLRQEFGVGQAGDIQLFADSLRSDGPDSYCRPWKKPSLNYRFRSGEAPAFNNSDTRNITRSLEEGWLPVVHHDWKDDAVQYRQTTFATCLTNDPASLASTNGLEPLALLTRFELKNNSAETRTASLWMALDDERPWRIAVDGTLVLLRPSDGQNRIGLAPVRGRFNTHEKGSLEIAVAMGDEPGASVPAIHYQVSLSPGETHAIDLALAYIELLRVNELQALKQLQFEKAHTEVVNFWRERVNREMTLETPEPLLNDFFKASLWHVLISTDIDPLTGLHEHGAATHVYKNFLNETMMVARSLEMRGEQNAARKLIEPFLRSQSAKGLPGNFQTRAGVLYAAYPTQPDPYTAQGYNMHHGWGLWGAAEHYLWTRDSNWLLHYAPALIMACDWITAERQTTKFTNYSGAKPVEYGLMPAGDLEDVEEYLYYYATDAYDYLGMRKTAAALADINYPVAPRITKDADDFLHDLQVSVAEAAATTPVIRLRDGTYAPYVPPRAHALTHLSEGWIREGLYPALHLFDGGVFPENHPFASWMLNDLEDNIFPSAESGFGISNYATNFFDLGGFTLQPNLLNNALVYLKRDQTANFLRAFYNTFAASIYPDVRCFAEWVPRLGEGGGPLFKTPDESRFIQLMRQMLILEREDTLELGLGVPRAWMEDGKRIKVERAATFFGRLDMEIVSHAAQQRVEATVRLNAGRPPRAVFIRLHDSNGRAPQSVRVNGRKASVDENRQLIELPDKATEWKIVAEF